MKKIGILGGGQLALMTLPYFKKLDLEPFILDPNPNCSCAKLVENFICGDFNNFDEVVNFAKNLDIITIEIENVSVEALEFLEKSGKIVRPSSRIIKTIQNKFWQKQFFATNNFPTAEFLEIKNPNEVELNKDFLPAVQKLCYGGYDGKGVQILQSKNDLQKKFSEPSILEKLVDIEQELSVIVARNSNQEIQTFPTVGQDFDKKANLVKFVYAPANISREIEDECQKIAKKMAENLELEGVLAVEFFLTKNGEILINEVAPRPHNSGHWTIEGCEISQFEQFLRGISNLQLKPTNIIKPSVMVNLLGSENNKGKTKILGLEKIRDLFSSTKEKYFFHWYGKTETHPQRKMGHCTILADSIILAKEIGEKILKNIKIMAE